MSTPTRFEPKAGLPAVVTDLPITEDQALRVAKMVYGNQSFDLDGQYTAPASPEPQTVQAIHFMSSKPEGALGAGATVLDGVDDVRFEACPTIHIEGEDGTLHGHDVCRQFIASRHTYGFLLADSEGGVWLADCGFDRDGSQVDQARAAPLVRLANGTVPLVELEVGEVSESLPAEGEFTLTEEELPRISYVPWWGEMDGDVLKVLETRVEEARLAARETEAEPSM